jgi:hypothetical protein
MVQSAPKSEQLVEAWGDWVDPREYLTEDPDFTGGGSLYFPHSRIEDRQEGRCIPYYENESDLARLRGQARNLAAIDSIAIGAKDARKHYVIGPGYKFRVQDVHVDTAAINGKQVQSELAQAAQRVIDQFLDDNDFTCDLDQELFDRTADDGEPFLWLVRHGNRIVTRILEPDQITEPRSPRPLEDWLDSTGIQPCAGFVSSWTFGVHTDARFPHVPLGYHVIHDSSGSQWDYVPACEMLHIKRNVPRNAKRGVSDYFPIMSDMRNEAKLATNIVTGAALQAAIAWIEEHPPGTTQEQVQALAGRLAETTVPRPAASGGTQSRNVQRYRPGTILRPSPGRKYVSGPMGSERSTSFIEVAQFMLRRVGVRWTMPEYMISGDASNANFSSTLVAESPFVKARESDQRFFGSYFHRLIWKVLKIAYRMGAFGPGVPWQQIEESIDVNVEPPKVSTRDPLEMAQTQEIQMRIGILSKRTAATQSSLDYDAEVENGAQSEATEAPIDPLADPLAAGMPPADMQTSGTPDNLAVDDISQILNGAQITAAKDLLADVSAELTPPLVAVELLVALGIEQGRAQRMVQAAASQPKPEPEPLPNQLQQPPPSNAKQAAAAAALESVETTDEARAILRTLERAYP